MSLLNPLQFALPPPLSSAVRASLVEWDSASKLERLWSRDPSVWTDGDEAQWLGWLDIVADGKAGLRRLLDFAREIRADGFTHVLLLGMGGSSLAPEVLSLSFGPFDGCPRLHVLDSTVPAQVWAFEKRVPLDSTLFIVSSKSGTTLEPAILKEYFFSRVREVVGDRAGDRFVAITDPGSKLEEMARRDGFRQVFSGVPTIGGRYSALSNFGLVPGAAMGLDLGRLLDEAEEMHNACTVTRASDNPGALLGAVLGACGRERRDKVTFVVSPRIAGFGAWIEQLIAESTGKRGRALIPVDGERVGPPATYGDDRLFVYLRLATEPDAAQDEAVSALQSSGAPVVRLELSDRYAIGQEFFRWEMATAVASSILGVDPFDQPDVEASKVATRRLTDEVERSGSLPPEQPFYEEGEIRLFADPANQRSLAGSPESLAGRSLEGFIRSHLARVEPGDYVAVLAYIEMNAEHHAILHTIRHLVRDATRAATSVGFGPRFLHSTGQAYKGGPDTGVFLQITSDDAFDLPVPGHSYTFGAVKTAQARGDFQVLADRGRRLMRVHLGQDVAGGLQTLAEAMTRAVAESRRVDV